MKKKKKIEILVILFFGTNGKVVPHFITETLQIHPIWKVHTRLPLSKIHNFIIFCLNSFILSPVRFSDFLPSSSVFGINFGFPVKCDCLCQYFISFFSCQTKELITTLKMNGTVDAVTFTPDGSKMMSFGGKIFLSTLVFLSLLLGIP